MKLYLKIFVLLKLKLYKNKKYSKFIIRGRQRNPPEEGDIYLLQQTDDGNLFHQLQQTEVLLVGRTSAYSNWLNERSIVRLLKKT